MVNRKVDWRYLGFALGVTALIMTGIFSAGYHFNEYKVGSLEDRIDELEAQQQSMALQPGLSENLEGNECQAIQQVRSNTLSDIRELREEVETYEGSERIENDRYDQVKGKYINAVIQNMLDLEKLEEKCDEKFFEVVYFYSDERCGRCEDQGTVLNFFREENSDKVRIHPIDSDLDLETVDYMKARYNVTEFPTLMIEGEKHEGFVPKEELDSMFNEEINGNMTTNSSKSGEFNETE